MRRVVGTLPWFLNSLACLLFLATVAPLCLPSRKVPNITKRNMVIFSCFWVVICIPKLLNDKSRWYEFWATKHEWCFWTKKASNVSKTPENFQGIQTWQVQRNKPILVGGFKYFFIFPIWLILLVEEILHQLICSLSHYFQGLCIPGGAGFLPSTVFFKGIVCFNHQLESGKQPTGCGKTTTIVWVL